MYVAGFEGFLCRQALEKLVEICSRRLNLLVVPVSELELGAAVERPPVFSVVAIWSGRTGGQEIALFITRTSYELM